MCDFLGFRLAASSAIRQSDRQVSRCCAHPWRRSNALPQMWAAPVAETQRGVKTAHRPNGMPPVQRGDDAQSRQSAISLVRRIAGAKGLHLGEPIVWLSGNAQRRGAAYALERKHASAHVCHIVPVSLRGRAKPTTRKASKPTCRPLALERPRDPLPDVAVECPHRIVGQMGVAGGRLGLGMAE